MSALKTVYNAIFKRQSAFTLGVLVSAFFLERVIDSTADFIFDRLNEGKLWKHIKPKE